MKAPLPDCPRRLAWLALALAAGAVPGAAQTLLTNEHVDVGINYADGAWDLHLHDETNDREFAPDEAVLQVGALAQTTVPGDPSFSFLGGAGSPVWILPALEDPNLLFLGIGAEELMPGLFVNDLVTLTLRGLTGPGHFAVYALDPVLGTPQVFMNSRDGISSADAFVSPAGGHTDLNWAFTQPGLYTVEFEGSGTLAAGGVFSASGPVAYTFEVVPEPGTWALLGLGLGGAWLARRRRARA
jgi:surface-anchored protein